MKNDLAKRLQEQRKAAAADMYYLVNQVIQDSVILTLGYGESMKTDPWGAERIQRFLDDLKDQLELVWNGLSDHDDADYARYKVDSMLQKKLGNLFDKWEVRYGRR